MEAKRQNKVRKRIYKNDRIGSLRGNRTHKKMIGVFLKAQIRKAQRAGARLNAVWKVKRGFESKK